MKDQPLSIEIKNGRLEMSIGVDCLLAAIEYGLEMRAEEFEVTDKSKWLGEIVNALHIEEEDGSTVIHRAIDTAALQAIENGAEGIEFID